MSFFDFGKKKRTSKRRSSLTYIDSNGYKRYSDSNKLVHRHVASRKLGRPLKKEERVHHKNRDKGDNSRKNLKVYPNQIAHTRAHKKSKKYRGVW